MHGRYETDEPEIMIAMEMADKHSFDAAQSHIQFRQLYLCSFPAINQNILAVQLKQLGCLVPVVRRNSRVIAKNFDLEYQQNGAYSESSSS